MELASWLQQAINKNTISDLILGKKHGDEMRKMGELRSVIKKKNKKKRKGKGTI